MGPTRNRLSVFLCAHAPAWADRKNSIPQKEGTFWLRHSSRANRACSSLLAFCSSADTCSHGCDSSLPTPALARWRRARFLSYDPHALLGREPVGRRSLESPVRNAALVVRFQQFPSRVEVFHHIYPSRLLVPFRGWSVVVDFRPLLAPAAASELPSPDPTICSRTDPPLHAHCVIFWLFASGSHSSFSPRRVPGQ